MANEWISLLQGAPTGSIDPIKTFQESQSRAIANKKNAYDLYRSQKAQEIVNSSASPNGEIDWDKLFREGTKAGIGLDAFEQAHKMQLDRAKAMSELKQQQSLLRSMGEDRTIWDPSAKPIDVVLREKAAEQNFEQVPGASTPEAFVAPSAEQANKYNFITQGATSGPVSPVQDSPVAPMAPAVGGGPVMDLGQKNVQVAQLPAPPMRDPNIDQAINSDGVYNGLWRETSNFGNVEQMFGGGASAGGAGAGSFDVSKMDNASKGRLEQYLADRGVAGADLQTAVNSLETRAIDSVPKPVMVQPEGTSFGDINKARNLNMKAVAEYAGKVAEAKIKFSEDMQKGNFGVLDKKLAQERQKYDLAGQKGNIFTREVSEPEARIVKLQRTSINDILDAPNTFAGAYQAAVAKAKSDGSVNQDAIISNLVSMGALPSGDAIYLKSMMSPEGGLTEAGKKWIINTGVGQRGPNESWRKYAVANINQYITDNGGRAVEYREPPVYVEEPQVKESELLIPQPVAPKVTQPVRKTEKDPLGLGI